jgi:serine/threonine protein kinase
MGNCLTISADDGYGGTRSWESHPEHGNWIEIHELGHGTFSKVVLAKHAFEKGRTAALKVVFVNDPMLDEDTKRLLVQEGELLHQLHHPNLVRCRHIYPSDDGVLIFELEYLKGTNLLDGIYMLRNTYSEKDAAKVFTQIVSAVGYLHDNGIIHRDIKPENIVFVDEMKEGMSMAQYYSSPTVKLLDLGLARRAKEGFEVGDIGPIGSAGFIAPEVILEKPHSTAMDVYSLGVLLFIMLVGRKPYNLSQSERLDYATIPIKDAPGLKDPRWIELSPDAKHLILGMLQENPKKRLACNQVLSHEWITTQGGMTLRHLGEDIALGVATVGEMRRLRYLDKGIIGNVDDGKLLHTSQRKNSGSHSLKGFKISISRGSSQSASRNASTKSGKERYLDALDRSIRHSKSVHGGGVMENMARSITAKSYSIAHDAGRSMHCQALDKSIREKSVHGKEVQGDRNHDKSQKTSQNGLQLLTKSLSRYVEERSVHGRRSSKGNNAGRSSGIDLEVTDSLGTKSNLSARGLEAGESMNREWRNSMDGSGSRGRRVNVVKAVE